MEDAEERQLKDKKVKIWLERLRDVASDADDLLDEINTRSLQKSLLMNEQQEMTNPKLKRMVNKVRMTCMTPIESFSIKYKMSPKLKEILEKLNGIMREMSDFQFTFKEDRLAYRRSDTIEKWKTGPYVDESKVYGREEDVDKIVEMLLSAFASSSSSISDVPVVPIVGFGGIRKTTLAQVVYNDERVASHFDLKMWVSINDSFNTVMTIKGILECATKHRCESSQFGELQSQLRESLCTKRYLLVLDDVWSEDPIEWDKIKIPLRGGTCGSKIIVTTRNEKVAFIMGTTPPYHLEELTKDHCWNLFKQRTFRVGEEESFPNLLPIGEQIVDKCKGVPFTANALGILMSSTREESEWLHVRDSELWSLDEGENRMLNILRLSYNHMSAHLKRCFAYCSVLPKERECFGFCSSWQLLRI